LIVIAAEIVKGLREMLPPQVDYAELVGAEGFARGCHYVWTEPEPYIISEAADLIENSQKEEKLLYQMGLSADDVFTARIEMTESEARIVYRVLKDLDNLRSGFCGTCWIDMDNPHSTEVLQRKYDNIINKMPKEE